MKVVKTYVWYPFKEFGNSFYGHSRDIHKISVVANSVEEAKRLALICCKNNDTWERCINTTNPLTEKVEVQIERIRYFEHEALIKAGTIPDWDRSLCDDRCVHD